MRFIIASLFLMFPVCAHAGEFRCPDDIQTEQTLKAVPKMWAPYFNAGGLQTFKGVTLYDGPPVEKASLVPDETGDDDTVWSGLKQGVPARRFWISCEYRNTAISLVHELPEAITQCRLQGKNVMICE